MLTEIQQHRLPVTPNNAEKELSRDFMGTISSVEGGARVHSVVRGLSRGKSMETLFVDLLTEVGSKCAQSFHVEFKYEINSLHRPGVPKLVLVKDRHNRYIIDHRPPR